MRLLLIVTVLVYYSVEKPVQDKKCPIIERTSDFNDFRFPPNTFWRVFAFSDPGMNTRSIFTMHETRIDLNSNCSKFRSNLRTMSHYCYINKALLILDITNVFINESKQETTSKKLYNMSNIHQFSDISVLDTDRESFITFYGCEEVDNHAAEGILILIEESQFENFNKSKLDISFDLLRPSFGFKILDTIQNNVQSKNCNCQDSYDELVVNQKVNMENFWLKQDGLIKDDLNLKAKREKMEKLSSFFVTSILVLGISTVVVLWIMIGYITSAEI